MAAFEDQHDDSPESFERKNGEEVSGYGAVDGGEQGGVTHARKHVRIPPSQVGILPAIVHTRIYDDNQIISLSARFTSIEANVSSPGFSMRKKCVQRSPSLGRIGTIATTADIALTLITCKSSWPW